jgi:ubiquinone/menaquinone biosynthesis C-methylase UbiE
MAEDLKKTQATFSSEWKMFRFGERNWGQTISFRKDQFLSGMAVAPGDLKNKLMFDAGCGSGLLSIELAKSFGIEVVALDLAFGVENAYRHNTSPYVYFMQGSVLEPPLRDRSVDFLYCCGVLVACPDTRTGFNAIVRTLKDGGRCFTWYYHPISPAYYPDAWRKLSVYNWIRTRITSRLPIRAQYALYLSWLPAFLIKQRIDILLKRRATLLTWREKMQAWFDFFSPIYQHRHTPAEIISWYQSEGFPDAAVAYREYEGFAVRGDLAGSGKAPCVTGGTER